jgi:hypothetical protein
MMCLQVGAKEWALRGFAAALTVVLRADEVLEKIDP